MFAGSFAALTGAARTHGLRALAQLGHGRDALQGLLKARQETQGT